ncbi:MULTISPECIES: EAL domain-containing protein [Acidobacterium]|nr:MULTISPECIES: EAL domain-containing protein [Acidobacterium]HCT60161.1 bifunctional diguanylate cyclase/phosphodiesterase [Acidobacterium sp.]
MLHGTYNAGLVLASLLVAMFASYVSLDMAGRIAAAHTRAVQRAWLAGGAIAMGIGIWSMHFIGMLAFRLPIPMGYNPWITFVSLLIAIASSAFALWRVSQATLGPARLIPGALLMGAGVCGMHYTGMAAMRMQPGIQYVPSLVALSVVIAVLASGAALWLSFHLRQMPRGSRRVRLLSYAAAIVMGCAIAGMHYTGMAAARFPVGSQCLAAQSGMTHGWLAALIILFSLAVLTIALIISVLDLRLELRTAVLATSLADANEELQFLALHDALTKLPNRALFEDRLRQEVEIARREQTAFAVLFLDLDGFKQINDAYGHHVGDLLLVEAAGRICASVRARDTLARLGGDEFVLLAAIKEPSEAANLADKLVSLLQNPFHVAELDLQISVSIGIAIFHGRDRDARDLVKHADAAMYHAKALGRSGYCFFEASMAEDAQNQLKLLQDLRLALSREELALYYQPKVETASRAVIGVEALVRWNHPERGLLTPDLFIPLAEKTGLIFQIGSWVLNEACRQMSLWRAAGHTGWTISVNLSAMQFNHPALIQMVRETLEAHALSPYCLMLEITETTAMHNADNSLAILQQLSDMGVRISIDDFGTGYSSLLYLKRLPASELKIDRGFVQDLATNSDDAAIIASIVALGRTLNLKVVAEGVETPEQQDYLAQLGCNSLQGYLLGRPLPGEEFLASVSPSLSA